MKNKKMTAGFTLVELIVVIAILGILAGVGTVGYSGYIKKANQAADEQLVAGVKNTLMLAGIQGSLKDGDAVVLTQSGVVLQATDDTGAYGAVTSGGAHDAMVAAFGEGYDTLALKYDGWTGTAATANIGNVNASNFGKDNLDVLLKDVSALSAVLADYFGSGVTYSPLTDYMDKNNIETADSQVLANLAVLQAADSIITADKDAFLENYELFNGKQLATQLQTNAGLDRMSSYAVAYAQTEGILNYIEAQVQASGSVAEKTAVAELRYQWTDRSSKLTSATDVDNLLTYMDGQFWDVTLESYAEAYYDEANGQVSADAEAFYAYMNGIQEVAPTITSDLNALKDSGYYSGATVNNLVNNYISYGEILNGSEDSTVIVLYSNGEVASYPEIN